MKTVQAENKQLLLLKYLGADHLIPGGGLWFFCEKKDCSANFEK